MTLLVWLAFLLSGEKGILEKVSEYAMPETMEGYWLERPHSLAVDAQGRVFIADQDARMVFVWDEKGQPLGVWGRPGNGPGEFRGPTFLDYAGDALHVLDPPAQRIEVFDKDGQPQRTLTLKGIFTSPMGFLARQEGGYVVVVHAVLEDDPSMKTVFLDAQGVLVKVIHAFPDQSFELKESSSFVMQLTAYSGETTLTRFGEGYAIACGYQPEILVFTTGKEDLRTIPLLNLPNRLVTERDKEEFMEMEIPWMDGSFKAIKDLKRNIQVRYPETMPFFSGVAGIGSNYFLVYEFSKFSRILKGRIFHASGKAYTPSLAMDLELNLGWQGTFHLVGNQLYTLRYSEDDSRFSIQKYHLELKGGS